MTTPPHAARPASPARSRQAVIAFGRAARPRERGVELAARRVRLDVAPHAERLEQTTGQWTVLLEPVAVELLGRQLLAPPDDEDELDRGPKGYVVRKKR